MNQLYIYIYPHISSFLCLPPTLPLSHPSRGVTKHRADIPVLCSCFPLANYFTFVHATLSLRPSLPFHQCPQVHSLRLCLYSCPAPRFLKATDYISFLWEHLVQYAMCTQMIDTFDFSGDSFLSSSALCFSRDSISQQCWIEISCLPFQIYIYQN